MSRASIERRLERVSAIVEQRQDSDNDATVLALIQASLIRSLSVINPDGTLPPDFAEQLAAIESDYTPAQHAAMERWGDRYHAAAAKEQMLHELEQQIANEEMSA